MLLPADMDTTARTDSKIHIYEKITNQIAKFNKKTLLILLNLLTQYINMNIN